MMFPWQLTKVLDDLKSASYSGFDGRKNYDKTKVAAIALTTTRNSHAIQPLKELTCHPDDDIKRVAFKGLCLFVKKRRSADALDVLRSNLSHSSHSVRWLSGVYLEDLAERGLWQPSDGSELARFLVARERYDEAAKLGFDAIDPLMEDSDHDRYKVFNALTSFEMCAHSDIIVSKLSERLRSIPKVGGDPWEEVVYIAKAMAQLGLLASDQVRYDAINALEEWPSWLPVILTFGFLSEARPRKDVEKAINELRSKGGPPREPSIIILP